MTVKHPSIAFSIALALAANLGFSSIAHAQQENAPRHGFSKMDSDGDGVISKDEFLARHQSRFAQVDTDGDGVVSEDEKAAAKEARRAKREERRAKIKERREQAREKILAEFDANGDGQLDASEREAVALNRFERMDKNGDGVLSEDELPKRRHGHYRKNR